MSAIFGIINKKKKPVEQGMIDKMQQNLLHRAVNGKSIYREGNMMFGHHKLIVHRRQAQENQPFLCDNCVITCDARIDNIDDLFSELNLIATPENYTDSFIILQAYKRWGSKCVSHLEGEFCFAVYNTTDEIFFGACDHIGLRSFYYYENNDFIAFSSEIIAISTIKTEPIEFNQNLVIESFTNYHNTTTFDKKINLLPPANYLLLKAKGELKKEKYWRLRKTKFTSSISKEEWYAYVNKLIIKKIACEIDSDYPVGILLSGGLDSSYITAIACSLLKKTNRKLLAFSSVLPEYYQGKDNDERFYIEKLKEHFDNLEVYYVTIPDNIGPYSDLERVFESTEAPMSTFHYVESHLFKKAKECNVRTLLTGFGGDMALSLFVCDEIYQNILEGNFFTAIKLLLHKFNQSRGSLKHLIRSEILQYLPIYQKIRMKPQKNKQYSYYPLDHDWLNKVIELNEKEKPNYKKNFSERINEGEICSSVQLLRKHAQSYQMEFLSPMLSKEICAVFMQIPIELFNSGGKERSFIKEMMRDLVPSVITERNDKLPFSPDYNSRIAKFTVKDLEKILLLKPEVRNAPGISYQVLTKLIADVQNKEEIESQMRINYEIYFIPVAIIFAKFYAWVLKRPKSL